MIWKPGFLCALAGVFLAAAFSTPSNAAELCVNPADVACYATIQEAVDEAATGDVITIHPKADGSAYNEGVIVETPGLTLTGSMPGELDKILNRVGFGGVKAALTLKDADAKTWLKNYANGKELKKEIKTLAKVSRQKIFLTTCPGVMVESCQLRGCGRLEEPPSESGIRVEANDTTLSHLSIRHGLYGVAINPDVTGTTISNICFRANSRPIGSAVPRDWDYDTGPNERDVVGGNHNTTIRSTALLNASSEYGIRIVGDDVVLEENILVNTDGIEVKGDDYRISRNAIAGTNDYECFDVLGADGIISNNLLLDCEGAISAGGSDDLLVQGNLVLGSKRSREMIRFGRSNGQVALGATIRHNVLRLGPESGMDLEVTGAIVEGNLVESTGNRSYQAGIEVKGSNNILRGNLLRTNSYSGIHIRVNDGDFVEAGLTPGSWNNEIRDNYALGNGTSGIVLGVGEDVGAMDSIPAKVQNTLIADNYVQGNHGEGVAIAAGSDPRDSCPVFCSYDSGRDEWKLYTNDYNSCEYWTSNNINASGGVCVVTTGGFTEQDCDGLASGSWDSASQTCRFDLPNDGEDRCLWLGGTWDDAASFCGYSEAAIAAGLALLAPEATTLSGNTIVGNRTDLCNQGTGTVIEGNNTIQTGGIDTDCMVETGSH